MSAMSPMMSQRWGGDMSEDAGTVLLTYAELAQQLRIKIPSAKRLSQRRKWHRVIGNDGVARVHVPVSTVTQDVSDDVAPDRGSDVASDVSLPVAADLSHLVARLEGVVEGLQRQIEAEQKRATAEQQRADAAEARVQDISADREAWKRQAQRSIWSRLFGSG